MSFPPTMRAAVLHQYAPDTINLSVEDVPTPQPGANEVLVRIAASPLNPSDLSFMTGFYGFKKPLPTVPGFEAGGTVVAVGEGVNADEWIGRRVACAAGDGFGTYAQYMRTSMFACFPIADGISEEQASMMVVNPLTAWAMLDIARQSGIRAVVQTAAASALGRMIARLGEQWGIAVMNIVRRAEQVAMLRTDGATHVLDSSADGFDSALREWCRGSDARLALDAVGGALTDRVLRAMPHSSRIIVYGGLSAEPVRIGVDQLIFRNKAVEGFWLTTWMRDPSRLPAAWTDVQAAIGTAFATEVRARCPLEDINAAVRDYAGQMSGGKVLIVP